MTTAYCPKCREDIEVSWPSPPYSVKHIDGSEDVGPFHVHPEANVVVDEAWALTQALTNRAAGSIPYAGPGPQYMLDTSQIPARITVTAEVFDRLTAELEEPPKVIPELAALMAKPRTLSFLFDPLPPGMPCPYGPHRGPEGPNEDLAQCGRCGAPTWALRPEGETFGDHLPDCSLPLRHEGRCQPGGRGHPRSRDARGPVGPGGFTSE